MFDLSKIKKEKNSTEWYCEENSGSDLIIPGTENGPDPTAFYNATLIIENLETIKKQATELLELFIKQNGNINLNTIKLSTYKNTYDGDFLVEFSLRSESNTAEYIYTRFQVYFLLNKLPAKQKTKPLKFTVEFF